MYLTTQQYASQVDLFIAAAAVADYTPEQYAEQKIKKHDSKLSISLARTVDILKEIKLSYPSLFCVGFAAETESIIQHAQQKLTSKSLDMIIANQVGLADQGFNSDFNAVEIITKQSVKSLSRARKSQLARIIIEDIALSINQLTKHSNVSYLQSTKN